MCVREWKCVCVYFQKYPQKTYVFSDLLTSVRSVFLVIFSLSHYNLVIQTMGSFIITKQNPLKQEKRKLL